jgi:hypothetical protein
MLEDVSKALSSHLATMVDLPPVSAENSDLYTPVSGELYLTERTIFGKSFGLELNSTKQQRYGTYEVTVYAPKGENKFATHAEADKILSHFQRGLRLTENGTEVVINRNQTGQTSSSEDSHILPVYISFWFYA